MFKRLFIALLASVLLPVLAYSQSIDISPNSLPLYLSGSNPVFTNGSNTVTLAVEAANILAQHNSTNAQGLRIYNTYTDASNYERGSADWNLTTNEFIVGTEAAGTGSLRTLRFSAAAIGFRTSGATRWQMDASGNFLAQIDNTYDIGTSGTARPRSIYVGTLVNSPGYYFPSNGGITSSGDGVLLFRNNAGTDFIRVMFGGSTSSFPALKRSSTSLQVRLADDSNYASFISDYATTAPHTVAGLTSAAAIGAGSRSFVNDALAPTFGAAVTGGGTVKVPVYSDGTTWIVGANTRTSTGANDNTPTMRIGLNFAA